MRKGGRKGFRNSCFIIGSGRVYIFAKVTWFCSRYIKPRMSGVGFRSSFKYRRGSNSVFGCYTRSLKRDIASDIHTNIYRDVRGIVTAISYYSSNLTKQHSNKVKEGFRPFTFWKYEGGSKSCRPDTEMAQIWPNYYGILQVWFFRWRAAIQWSKVFFCWSSGCYEVLCFEGFNTKGIRFYFEEFFLFVFDSTKSGLMNLNVVVHPH